MALNRGEIPRSARNDKIDYFFRSPRNPPLQRRGFSSRPKKPLASEEASYSNGIEIRG